MLDLTSTGIFVSYGYSPTESTPGFGPSQRLMDSENKTVFGWRLMVESLYFYLRQARTSAVIDKGDRFKMRLRLWGPRVVAALLAGVFGAAVVANAQDIGDSAYQQIVALLLEKDSRTAAQRKLSASLVY